MKKKPIIVIALIVVVGAVFLVIRNGQKQDQLQTKISQASSSQAVETSAEVKINISNFAFDKQVIKIKKGTKVIWTNQDPTKHTVTSDTGDFLNSELFGKGESYEKVFDQVGTFSYHCKPHSQMIASVVVVE